MHVHPVRVMADPARVKNEPGSDVTATENVHQDKNVGEGTSGGNAALEAMTDQTATKQSDKVVRCDPVHTTMSTTHRHKKGVGMVITFPNCSPLPLQGMAKEVAGGDEDDEGHSSAHPLSAKKLKVEPEKKKEKRHKVDEDEIQKMQ